MARKQYIIPKNIIVVLDITDLVTASNTDNIVTMPDGNEAVEIDPDEKQDDPFDAKAENKWVVW